MKIEYLKLFTANLEDQKRFYEGVLKLPVANISESSIRVKAGYSLLEFEESSEATPYHIAFHVPTFSELDALQWLEERLIVLKDEGEKIIDFPAWKAKSVYFYDADQNILEFIARKDLFETASGNFSAESILGLSEIGLATEDVGEKFRFLNQNFALEKFTGDYQHFCATGDDEGLVIIIDKNNKDWIPAGDKAYSSAFEMHFRVQKASYRLIYKNESLKLL